MESRIEETLASIGFTKNEQKLYLDLMHHKKSTALEIAKRTKIHRTNIYDGLRTLLSKGFIEELIEDNKRFFSARKPDVLVDYLTQKKQEVEEILPLLKNMPQNTTTEESVNLSKGNFSLRETILSLLDIGCPISIYGAPKEAPQRLGIGFLESFHKQRIKRKILMRHIYNENARERIAHLNSMPYTEARFLPKKYGSIVTTAICGEMVTFIIFTDPISIISIKNRKIADAYNNYFEILWSNSYS